MDDSNINVLIMKSSSSNNTLISEISNKLNLPLNIINVESLAEANNLLMNQKVDFAIIDKPFHDCTDLNSSSILNMSTIYYRKENEEHNNSLGIEKLLSKIHKTKNNWKKRLLYQKMISYCSIEILSSSELRKSIINILNKLNKLLKIDRSYLYENHFEQTDEQYISLYCEANNNIIARNDLTEQIKIPYKTLPEKLIKSLYNSKEIYLTKDEENIKINIFFKDLEHYSTLIIPIFIDNILWGFIGFDIVKENKIWNKQNLKLIRRISLIISLAINQKLCESIIKKSEEKFRDLYETSNIGMFKIYILDKKIMMCNKSLLRFLGFSESEISDKNNKSEQERFLVEFWSNNFSNKTLINQLKNQGFLSNYENSFINQKGEKVDFLISAKYYPDEDVAEVSIIDITEWIKTRSQLSASIKEKMMLEEQIMQSSKMAGIGEMAAGMAHELNQPITAIMSFAQSLQGLTEKETFIKERFTRNLNFIISLSKKTSEIIDELKFFAKPSKKDYEDVNINNVIKQTLVLLNDPFIAEGIYIETSLEPSLPCCKGNFNQLQQVLVNLLSNSKDACEGRPGKKISIMTSYTDNNIYMSVEDTGYGIPESILDNIFIPFITTKERHKGIGLGLSIVYRILNEHQGKINVTSKIDVGTKFEILFPICN